MNDEEKLAVMRQIVNLLAEKNCTTEEAKDILRLTKEYVSDYSVVSKCQR